MRADSPAAAATRLIEGAIARRLFPAAVAEVGSTREIIWTHSSGTLTFEADAPSTTLDTIFDLASLTKPLATTAVVLRLVSSGRLALDQRITSIVPEWTGADRVPVTVRDLLEHTGGLSARLLDQPPDNARSFEHEICHIPLEYAPRTKSIYTDLGFILLAFMCERVTGSRFTDLVGGFLTEASMAGGGLAQGLYARVDTSDLLRTAPTTPMLEDRRRGRRLVGDVHDNYAAALGGLAGHAGLFGTAAGVGEHARLLLRALQGDRSLPAPFTPDLAATAISRSTVPGSSRALGWDTMKPTSSCGVHLSPSAFGHVGFTGTSLWVDPARDRYYVLLSNRVCNGGTSDEMQALRRAFHDLVAAV